MRTFAQAASSLALALISITPLSAMSFGTNITISDKNFKGSGWYSNREDQETETNPDTITGQVWDMEGMFLDGMKLTLVGGFDFKNGVTYSKYKYRTGDIFIDVDGDAVYGQAANGGSGAIWYGPGPHTAITSNTFGYDYVLDLDVATGTYDVLSLSSASKVVRVLDVASSNPWTYSSGGTAVAGFQDLAFGYWSGLTNAQTGFQGDSTNATGWSTGSNAHYALQVDLTFLAGSDATFHYTMECGNDNLMGRAHVPDSGSVGMMALASMFLIAAARRRTSR